MWTLVGSQPPTFLGLVGRSDIRSQKTCGLWWSVIHYVGFVDRSGANRVTGRIDSFVFSFFLKWQTTVIARMYLAVGIIEYGSIFYLPMNLFSLWVVTHFRKPQKFFLKKQKQKHKYMFCIWNLRNYLNPPIGLRYAI